MFIGLCNSDKYINTILFFLHNKYEYFNTNDASSPNVAEGRVVREYSLILKSYFILMSNMFFCDISTTVFFTTQLQILDPELKSKIEAKQSEFVINFKTVLYNKWTDIPGKAVFYYI